MQPATHAPLRGGYMRHFRFALLLTFAASLAVSAQNPASTLAPPAPQSARQALIEMFMGKGDNDFTRHLPEDARRILIHKGETAEYSTVLKLANLGRAAQAQGAEAFDMGTNILVIHEKNSPQTIEVAVEHDSLLGEEDEIELSFRIYKNGQPQSLPIIPRLIFTLKSEKEIWRLTEVTIAGHIPLTDADYLKELRREQDEVNEGAAQMRVMTIAAAESAYAARHPDAGYTCALSSLITPNSVLQDSSAQPTLQQPQLFDSGQGNEDYNGYRFTLSGCDGNPASKYRVIATPSDPDTSTKTFCADESGAVKSLADGSPTSCFSRGQSINSPPQPTPPVED
jgi:hypothetical protein